MNRKRTLALSGMAVLVAVLVAVVLYALVPGAKPKGADPNDAALVARGGELYAAQCASCHGARLEGQPNWRSRKPDGRLPAPPHDASGHTWHHPDADLFAITRNGIAAFAPPGYQSDMPAFGGVLEDADIWAVLAFIKSRWPDEVRRRQAALNEPARP